MYNVVNVYAIRMAGGVERLRPHIIELVHVLIRAEKSGAVTFSGHLDEAVRVEVLVLHQDRRAGRAAAGRADSAGAGPRFRGDLMAGPDRKSVV